MAKGVLVRDKSSVVVVQGFSRCSFITLLSVVELVRFS